MTRTGLARLALALALVCAIAAGASGYGYRYGVWSLGTGFGVLRWAAYGAIAAALIAIVAAALTAPSLHRRGLVPAIVALMIAVVTFSFPALLLQRAKSTPDIHDITTDFDDPPPLVAVLPARAKAPNSAQYGGPDVAAKQRSGYPEVQPLNTPNPPDVTFARALAIARDMGFEIVATTPASGIIEATDTTRWFGFKDDIVVRVRPAPGGSRVDMRSVSRIGGSDIGTNAKRVERYLAALADAR